MIVERLQQKLKPYKFEENNDIEIKAIVAGTTMLFSGLIFEESAEDNYSGFETLAFIVIIAYNSIFLLQWTLLFLQSSNFKNSNIRKSLELFGVLICKSKVKSSNNDESSYDENVK